MSRRPSPDEAGRLALQRLDQVLQKKPDKDDYALTEATQSLCTYRDALIEAARGAGEAERKQLERLNAVISLVVATHFPLGAVPWDALVDARGWLAELMGEGAPTR